MARAGRFAGRKSTMGGGSQDGRRIEESFHPCRSRGKISSDTCVCHPAIAPRYTHPTLEASPRSVPGGCDSGLGKERTCCTDWFGSRWHPPTSQPSGRMRSRAGFWRSGRRLALPTGGGIGCSTAFTVWSSTSRPTTEREREQQQRERERNSVSGEEGHHCHPEQREGSLLRVDEGSFAALRMTAAPSG